MKEYLFSDNIAIADILKDAHIEEDRLLRDKAYFRSEPLNVELANVDSVQIDRATVDVVEPQE